MKKITYHSRHTLSASEMNAVNKLIRSCSEHDKTHESIDLSVNSSYTFEPSIKLFHTAKSGKELVGIAALFIPTPDEAEITSFVHPSYRKKGVFNNLLTKVKTVVSAYNIPSLLFICNAHSESGKSMLKNKKIPYEFTEYSMKLEPGIECQPEEISLKKMFDKDIEELITLNVNIFNGSEANARVLLENTFKSEGKYCFSFLYEAATIGIGCLAHTHSEDTAFIFGFGILPEYRGKGLGKLALCKLARHIHLTYNKPAGLEVNSQNHAAYSLYTSLGFKTVSAYRYYRKLLIPVS